MNRKYQMNPVSEHANQADSAALRIDLYALLAALLANPPSTETIRSLAALTTLPGLPAALNDDLQALKRAAESVDVQSVNREYNALFIGMGRGELVPYASWYRDRLLMAAPLARLRSDLAGLNLKRRDNVFEPEDHAAALLECMMLIIAENDASDANQSEFFSAHLDPWLGRFFRDLDEAPSAAFYKSVGRLGVRFLEMERLLLQVDQKNEKE